MLVEDDDAVRFLTSRLLKSVGYQVREAASGPKALELWRAYKTEIALVLTDMIMPQGMSGRELVDQLVTERPALKVIFMSGYSDDTVGDDTAFLRRTQTRFLQKPCFFTNGNLERRHILMRCFPRAHGYPRYRHNGKRSSIAGFTTSL